MTTYDSIDAMAKEDRHEFYRQMISESTLRKKFENEREELIAALKPFASIWVPSVRQGNAGMYSLFFADIERAQKLLAAISKGASE